MCKQCFVQAENYSNRSYLPVMKEGFTFNYDSLKFLRKPFFKNFGGGGGQKQEPHSVPYIKMQISELGI